MDAWYQGWVVKQGGSIKTWKRRWLIVRASGLSYQDQDFNPSFVKEVDAEELMRVASVEQCGEAKWPRADVSSGFGFTVAGGRTYFAMADSPDDAIKLQTLLNLVVLRSCSQSKESAAYRYALGQLNDLVQASAVARQAVTAVPSNYTYIQALQKQEKLATQLRGFANSIILAVAADKITSAQPRTPAFASARQAYFAAAPMHT